MMKKMNFLSVIINYMNIQEKYSYSLNSTNIIKIFLVGLYLNISFVYLITIMIKKEKLNSSKYKDKLN